MDNTIALYLIKSSIALALFYGLYMLFLNKDTLFGVRRVYFLFAILFSVVFPLFTIELSPLQDVGAEPPIYTYWLSQIEVGAVEVETAPSYTVDGWTILSLIIIGISAFLAFRLIVQMLSVIRLRANNESYRVSSFRIIELKDTQMTPFSFFKWIFVNKEFQNEEKLKEIIAHEHVHARQFHSIDVVLYELLCIVFWWNPFSWLLRNEMKLNLEYLADEGVINAGFNSKEYQYILLKVSNKNTGIPIINNFNVSQLKKRITMMNKKRTSIVSVAKYMMAFPLAFVLLLGNAVYASPTEFTNIIDEFNTVEKTTEKKPMFVGGEDAMYKFLINNLKYPIEAQETNIEGKISAKLKIKKTGEIASIDLTAKADEMLNKEVKRVLNEMPVWGKGEADTDVDLAFYFKIKGNGTKLPPKEKGELDIVIMAYGPAKKGIAGESQDKQKPFTIVDQMPSYPGGEEAMSKFISENIMYPVEAQEAGVQGRVIVRYIVSKTGEIKDAAIVRGGLSPECDKEALRVVNAMPKWVPGKQNGETVDVYFTLPIVFRLNKGVEKPKKVEVAQLQKGNESSSGLKPFTVVEQMPAYPGGEEAMHKFVSENLKYPVKAQTAGISGRVTVRYIVTKTGELKDVVIVRGIDPECDKEALRVVNAMPKWEPGKQNGQVVDVYYTLPIVFNLK